MTNVIAAPGHRHLPEATAVLHTGHAAWLEDPRNRVDQKQVDALQMLRALQALRVAAPGPKAVPWTFMSFFANSRRVAGLSVKSRS